jgi:hypothetical protein
VYEVATRSLIIRGQGSGLRLIPESLIPDP